MKTPTVMIVYHFFYPDDVVSARHFSAFAEELAKRGWKVTVLASNRYCRYPERKIEKREEDWNGVRIIRASRFGLNQSKPLLRIVNSLWMMLGWTMKLLFLPKADVIIVGSDPQFSQLLFPVIRWIKRRSALVYWCYDLFPEAILANGAKGLIRWGANNFKRVTKRAYRFVDLMVDIGQCMRKRLDLYKHPARRMTLTPWALVEPNKLCEPDPAIRYDLFGDTNLGLLYSGNMGRAHDFELFLQLARSVYEFDPKITFCFACRGNRFGDLIKSIRSVDYNIRVASFADESKLEKRLNSADIHLLSLRPEWEGIVVPSKFFGSLAVGKPIIYSGPENSSIACWIRQFDVGLVLTANNIGQIVQDLVGIAQNPNTMEKWRENAIHSYHDYFSKKVVMDKWDIALRNLLTRQYFY